MRATLTLLALAWLTPDSQARRPTATLDQTIQRVEGMVWDGDVVQLASAHGLSVLNVTWEDTGRDQGSVWGPNISDMTIGVRDATGALHPMPVFRFDNFTDTTADLDSERFWLPVGNASGDDLRSVSLAELLKQPTEFLHDADSWTGRRRTLWDDRDTTVLVSAQACFLPVPRDGEATFTPVLYNYQSSPGNPAVLAIVATREGTSMAVIENDGGYMSQPLFFNADGERAPFTATRISDWLADGGTDGQTGAISANGEDGLNTVLLIQVPLKFEQPRRAWYDLGLGGVASPAAAKMAPEAESDVEAAVIGHGEAEGPHREINGLSIERDPRFPVRVTVQYYKATSNGVVTEADVKDIRAQIDRTYADADYVGSLVVGSLERATAWQQGQPEQATWASGWRSWVKAW